MCRCLFSVPPLSAPSFTMRMEELVWPPLNTQNRSGGQQPQQGAAARSAELGAPGTVQHLPPAVHAKLRANVQWPCVEVQTPAWGDAIRGIPKAAGPTPMHATSMGPWCHLPCLQNHGARSHSREKRIRQYFPLSSPRSHLSLSSSGDLRVLVAAQHPPRSVHGDGGARCSPGACVAARP